MCCPWEVCQLNLTKGWKVQDFVGSMSYLNTVKNCDTYPFQKKTLLFKRKLNKVDNAVRKKTTPRGMIRAGPELLYQPLSAETLQHVPRADYDTAPHLSWPRCHKKPGLFRNCLSLFGFAAKYSRTANFDRTWSGEAMVSDGSFTPL